MHRPLLLEDDSPERQGPWASSWGLWS